MPDILNLGAGNRLVAGAVQHDRTQHRPEIDVVHDLDQLPWPWADNSFDLVIACAVFEHLRNTLIETVNECWRVLRPGGVLHMKLPYWHSDNSFRDPTHYWHFSLSTCDLFDPTTKYGREYGFYGVLPWRIVQAARLNQAKSSFSIKMQVVKEILRDFSLCSRASAQNDTGDVEDDQHDIEADNAGGQVEGSGQADRPERDSDRDADAQGVLGISDTERLDGEKT